MKKQFRIMLLVFVFVLAVLPCMAMAEGTSPDASAGAGEPFTWQYLATIAGAAAFTLLVVQFFKVPLDRIWKIPTRVLAYVVALIIMLVATAFTTGLTAENVLLVAANAFLAAMSSYGAYEITFAKLNK